MEDDVIEFNGVISDEFDIYIKRKTYVWVSIVLFVISLAGIAFALSYSLIEIIIFLWLQLHPLAHL